MDCLNERVTYDCKRPPWLVEARFGNHDSETRSRFGNPDSETTSRDSETSRLRFGNQWAAIRKPEDGECRTNAVVTAVAAVAAAVALVALTALVPAVAAVGAAVAHTIPTAPSIVSKPTHIYMPMGS